MTTIPTQTRPTRARPSRRTRQVGYGLGAAIDLILIWLLLVEPGWRWVTFLTEEFGAVVGLITLSLVVGFLVNLVYIAYDPPWVKRLGDAVTAAFACVIAARLWATFPFDLSGWWGGWDTLFRIALAVATIGAAIAVVVNVVDLIRLTLRGTPSR